MCWYVLDKTAVPIVRAGQACPGMHRSGVALMGWLGLVWARDSGLTEVVGQIECLDLAPVCAVGVELWYLIISLGSTWREFQQFIHC